jgi:hypothetical protein
VRPIVLLAGEDLLQLFNVVRDLSPMSISPIVVESEYPVVSLLKRPVPEADVAIVGLDSRTNVVELRELLAAHPETHFIFLEPEFPPHAAVARIVTANGGVILRSYESPVVIAATLIGMLSIKARSAAS